MAVSMEGAAEVLLNNYLILFVGFVISTAMYGITVLQVLYYFRTYNKDSIALKLLTGFLFVLDSLTTILPSHAIYWWLILNFGNFEAGLVQPWTYLLENGVLTLITLMVQIFYTHQIWSLCRSKVLTCALLVVIIGNFGLGLVMTARLFIDPHPAALAKPKALIIASTIQGLAALCDITITVSLCYLLHTRRGGLKRTEKLIDKLILIIINRGLLTSVAQTCFLVLNASAPMKWYWIPFHQSVGKLYVNSYLAMLNIRRTEGEGVENIVAEDSIQVKFRGRSTTDMEMPTTSFTTQSEIHFNNSMPSNTDVGESIPHRREKHLPDDLFANESYGKVNFGGEHGEV